MTSVALWVRGLRRRSSARDILVLASGTAVAQGLVLAASPLLARLYSPEAFGLLGLCTAMTAVLGAAATWKYETAIVLPSDDGEAANLLLVALATCGVTVAALLALLALARHQLAEVFGAPGLASLLWWIPVALAGAGSYQALSHWAARRRAFGRTARARVAQSASVVGVQVSAAGAGAAGLVAGQAVGHLAGSAVLGAQICRSDAALIGNAVSVTEMRRVARAYSAFPRFSAPQGVLNATSQNVATFLLAYFFGPAAAGFYVLAQRAVQLPIGLVSDSVRQVFLQRASVAYNSQDDLHHLFLRSTGRLILLATAPAILGAISAPWLFGTVFGTGWVEAGSFARILVPWLFALFINPPAVISLQVLRHQRGLLAYDFALFAARASVLVAGGVWWTPIATLGAFSAVGFAFNIGLLLWASRATAAARYP